MNGDRPNIQKRLMAAVNTRLIARTGQRAKGMTIWQIMVLCVFLPLLLIAPFIPSILVAGGFKDDPVSYSDESIKGQLFLLGLGYLIAVGITTGGMSYSTMHSPNTRLHINLPVPVRVWSRRKMNGSLMLSVWILINALIITYIFYFRHGWAAVTSCPWYVTAFLIWLCVISLGLVLSAISWRFPVIENVIRKTAPVLFFILIIMMITGIGSVALVDVAARVFIYAPVNWPVLMAVDYNGGRLVYALLSATLIASGGIIYWKGPQLIKRYVDSLFQTPVLKAGEDHPVVKDTSSKETVPLSVQLRSAVSDNRLFEGHYASKMDSWFLKRNRVLLKCYSQKSSLAWPSIFIGGLMCSVLVVLIASFKAEQKYHGLMLIGLGIIQIVLLRLSHVYAKRETERLKISERAALLSFYLPISLKSQWWLFWRTFVARLLASLTLLLLPVLMLTGGSSNPAVQMVPKIIIVAYLVMALFYPAAFLFERAYFGFYPLVKTLPLLSFALVQGLFIIGFIIPLGLSIAFAVKNDFTSLGLILVSFTPVLIANSIISRIFLWHYSSGKMDVDTRKTVL